MTTEANPLGRLLGAGIAQSGLGSLAGAFFGRQQGKSDFLNQLQNVQSRYAAQDLVYDEMRARAAMEQAKRNADFARMSDHFGISRAYFENSRLSIRSDPGDIYITPSGRQKVYVNGKWIYTGPTTLTELDTMPVRDWLQAKTDEWLGEF